MVGENVIVGSSVLTGINFTVFSINNPTSLTLTTSGIGGTPSGTVLAGQIIISGISGFQGVFNYTTSPFVVPAADGVSTVTIVVTQPNNFFQGQSITVFYPATGAVDMQVLSSSGNSIVAYNTSTKGAVAAGITMQTGSYIVPGVGLAGISGGFAILRSAITVPAVGATVSATIGPSQYQNDFAVGGNVFIGSSAGGNNFKVVSITPTFGVNIYSLLNLGFSGDLAVGTVISGGTSIYAGTGNVTAAASGISPTALYIADDGSHNYTVTTSIAQVSINAVAAQVALATPGVYLVQGFARINGVGLTIPVQATATIKLNGILSKGNSGTAIANATDTGQVPNSNTAPTLCNGTLLDISIPPVVFTAAANDVVGLMIKYTISAGSLTGTLVVPECWITATRIS